ncbi:MAG: right-handed parallel beta-helix repeat-containing protein, partial [Candidatus Electryonea clarkiae]|nr:right-handed parallel beta-helix repeat-containing protein [Candidatus Electryonea clarkiae]
MRIPKDAALSMIVIFVLTLFLVPGLFADITGNVILTDSLWQDIGISPYHTSIYPLGTTEIYVEVRDLDRNLDPNGLDTLGVVFTSESELDFEYVILEEEIHGRNSGIFHGSIEVDAQAFMLARATDAEVATEIARLRLESPYNNEIKMMPEKDYEECLQDLARYNLLRKTSRYPVIPKQSRTLELDEVGILEIFSGDTLVAIYTDYANNWGNEEEITDVALFGGYSGDVSGQTWTAENNPYIVTGDAYTSTAGLTIEAGVVVQFAGFFRLTDHIGLNVNGETGDSVYFEPQVWYDRDGVMMEYVIVLSGEDGVIDKAVMLGAWVGLDSSASMLNSSLDSSGVWLTNSAFASNCILTNGIDGFILRSAANLYDCVSTGCIRSGVWLMGDCVLSGCRIIDNDKWGVMDWINLWSSRRISDCIITGNRLCGLGIFEGTYSEYVVRNCEIYDNDSDFDVYYHVFTKTDFRRNDWGFVTTAEMNRGDNPKNISRIYDEYDWYGGEMMTDGLDGTVKYAGYAGGGGEGLSGEVKLTDATWKDINRMYPLGTEEVFVEVKDENRNLDTDTEDTLGVVFSSQSEEDFEYVILTETDVNTSVFRGSITLNTMEFLLAGLGEEDVTAEMDVLREENPDIEDKYLYVEAKKNLMEALDESSEPLGPEATFELDEEGILEIYEGETISCTYIDPLGDFDVENEAIRDAALLGGISGDVSGQTWTVENSPYIIVGNIYTNPVFEEQWDDRLTIEAGVHVYVTYGAFYGTVEINGEEGDSVYIETNPDPDMPWYGYDDTYLGRVFLYFGDTNIDGIEYTVFSGGNRIYDLSVMITGIYYNTGVPEPDLDSIMVSHCRFFQVYAASFVGGNVSDCLIDRCGGDPRMGCTGIGRGIMSDCSITRAICHGLGIGGLVGWGVAERCEISGSGGLGVGMSIDDRHALQGERIYINDCDIFNNGQGFYGYDITYSGLKITPYSFATNCRIYNNGLHGITAGRFNSDFRNNAPLSINHCEIYDNESGIDFFNFGRDEIDAKYNYWGESTTEEMNNGRNPKNIRAIYDIYDEQRYGFTNYAHYVGSEYEGNTASIELTDGNWEDIGYAYPFGAHDIYVEVCDPDKNINPESRDTLGVEFSSESEEDFEYVILEETDTNTGLFHGSIEVDAETFMFARPTEIELEKELVVLRNEFYGESVNMFSNDHVASENPFFKFDNPIDKASSVKKAQYAGTPSISNVKSQKSVGKKSSVEYEQVTGGDNTQFDLFEEMLQQEANNNVQQRIIESSPDIKRLNELDEEGILEVFDGDVVTCTYIDQLNDWDVETAILDTVVFGGVSGNVDGQTWTAENSPYVISGDVYTVYGPLTIEAGVHVQFTGPFVIQTGGGLIVEGELEDSVYFESHELFQDESMWSVYANGGAANIDYAVFQGGQIVRFTAQASVTNCRVSGFGWSAYFTNNSSVSNCVFSDSRGGVSLQDSDMSECLITVTGGLQGSGNCTVSECIVTYNGSGISIIIEDPNSRIYLNNCSINNNGGNGIFLLGGERNSIQVPVIIRNCELYDNGEYEIRNCHSIYQMPNFNEVDARYNWWGETNTAEMENGENPQNISRIYDYHDYELCGEVQYCNYLLAPPSNSPGNYFNPVEGEETYRIVVTMAMIDDVPLVAGDEIGMFDYYPDEDGELVCVGAAIIEEEHDWEEDNITVHAIRRFDEDDIHNPGYTPDN